MKTKLIIALCSLLAIRTAPAAESPAAESRRGSKTGTVNNPQGWPESDANSPLSQAVEKKALELLATAPVRQAIAQGLQTLAASDAASKPEALRYVRSALEETANAYTERTVIT